MIARSIRKNEVDGNTACSTAVAITRRYGVGCAVSAILIVREAGDCTALTVPLTSESPASPASILTFTASPILYT